MNKIVNLKFFNNKWETLYLNKQTSVEDIYAIYISDAVFAKSVDEWFKKRDIETIFEYYVGKCNEHCFFRDVITGEWKCLGFELEDLENIKKNFEVMCENDVCEGIDELY